ncbi:sodium:calcium antiporter [Marinigracilibium pacificum]|uniref:Sodium:calcium antiporter n=1 Tax=Marinigracilibium pacificum TaxID=2729599 RepID=A0A848IT14_9BACT|nr:sodium:calcium antiporter [Marinigracilibium pacificum]NMM47477.1 sodium:calcium antiporter [Marinigracilibium pacificum]
MFELRSQNDFMELLFYISIIIISSIVVYWGGALLESTSEILADHYRLPSVVKGSIIMAVGSSFPELATVVVSTLIHEKFNLGISAIVGSAIFNILVIPGLCCVLYGDMKANKTLVFKDAQFYLTSIAVIMLMITMAVIYYPLEGEKYIEGNVSRGLAIMPVLLYGLYIYLQFADTRDHQKKNNDEERRLHENIKKIWVKLFFSLVLILISVEGLVRSALFLGDFFSTPDFFWGITVVAAATSVPDAVVSIKAAGKGDGTAGISNVLGSNIFDLLIAIPSGILIAGSASVNLTIAIPMILFLTVATIMFFAFLRFNLKLSKKEGIILLSGYLIFIVWMLLETFEIVSFVLN